MQTIDPKTRFEMTAFLHTVCEKTPSGLAVYKSGWNDYEIAKRFNCSPNSVIYARTSTIGPLQVKAPKKPAVVVAPPSPEAIGIGNEAAAIGALAARVKRLEEQNDELTKTVKDLADYITRPRNGGSNGYSGTR